MVSVASLLPKRAKLNRSHFYPAGEGKWRLTISIDHHVNGMIAGIDRQGSARIDVNIDFSDEKGVFNAHEPDYGVPLCGVQSSDLLAQGHAELRPKVSYLYDKVTKNRLDFRRLSEVLGAASAMGVFNKDFDVCASPAKFRTIGTGWELPDYGKVAFGPSIATTANEFATLGSLCGYASCDVITMLTDMVPGTGGVHLVGRKLSALCIRIQANIEAVCNDAGCREAHRAAFEFGKTHVMTVNGHTHEGGWFRNLMKNVRYPPCVGIIFGTGTHFDRIPLQESIDLDDVFRVVLGSYLEFTALFSVADIMENGHQSVFTKNTDTATKPGDYDGFEMNIYRVYRGALALSADLRGLHEDTNDSCSCITHYIENPGADRHFGHKNLVPWTLFEISPFLVKSYDGVFVPAKHGENVTLPLFDAKGVKWVGPPVDNVGRCTPGTELYVTRNETSLRREGASYLMSMAYSSKNGASDMSYVYDGIDGESYLEPMMIDRDGPRLPDTRWHTPHNPMPIDVEGKTGGDTCIKITVTSVRDSITPHDAMHGTVISRFGMFRIVNDSPEAPVVAHKHVPRYMQRRLNMLGKQLFDVHSYGVNTIGHAPSVDRDRIANNNIGPNETPGVTEHVKSASQAPVTTDTRDGEHNTARLQEEAAVLRSLLDTLKKQAAQPMSEGRGGANPHMDTVDDTDAPGSQNVSMTRVEPSVTAEEADGKGPRVNMLVADSGVALSSKRVKAPGRSRDDESGNGN